MVPAREPAPPQCPPASRAKADNELAMHGQHDNAHTMYVHGSKRGLASPALLQPLGRNSCLLESTRGTQQLPRRLLCCIQPQCGFNSLSCCVGEPEVQSSPGVDGHLQQHDMHPSLSAPGRVPAGSKGGCMPPAKCCASRRRAETALSSHDIVQNCISCATLMRPGAAAERCKGLPPPPNVSRKRDRDSLEISLICTAR